MGLAYFSIFIGILALAEMNEEFLQWHIGRQAEVLVEEKVSFGGVEYFLGHTKEYVKIAVPAAGVTDGNMENKLIKGTVVSRLKEHVLCMENLLEEKS